MFYTELYRSLAATSFEMTNPEIASFCSIRSTSIRDPPRCAADTPKSQVARSLYQDAGSRSFPVGLLFWYPCWLKNGKTPDALPLFDLDQPVSGYDLNFQLSIRPPL